MVGVGETDNGLLRTGLVRQKKQMPDVVMTDDLRHLVGKHVNLYARPIERLDFDRLTFSPELPPWSTPPWVGCSYAWGHHPGRTFDRVGA